MTVAVPSSSVRNLQLISIYANARTTCHKAPVSSDLFMRSPKRKGAAIMSV